MRIKIFGLCLIALLILLIINTCDKNPTSPSGGGAQTFVLTSADNFFTDVPSNHWAHDYIKILFDKGYIFGRSIQPLKYEPDQNLTRAEIAVFVVRGIHGVNFIPDQPEAQLLADVPLDHWAVEWVTQLYNDHYTYGTDEFDKLGRPYYRPEFKINRAEACVYFLRMLKGADYKPPDPKGIFSDVPIEEWYAKWVEEAYEENLICPYKTDPKLEIRPLAPITRAMTAYMMSKAKKFEPQQNRNRDVSEEPIGIDIEIETEFWKPIRLVNLATQIKKNSPNSQYTVFSPERDEYYPEGEFGYRLCGQICLSMILETRTLEKYKLIQVINAVNVPKETGTFASDLARGVEKLFPSWTKTSWWDFEKNDNINLLRDKLIDGHYLITLHFFKITNGWCMLVTEGVDLHWVVITGFTKNWNIIDNNSGLNWVRINNPFNNRIEYYPIRDFKKSLTSNTVFEIY